MDGAGAAERSFDSEEAMVDVCLDSGIWEMVCLLEPNMVLMEARPRRGLGTSGASTCVDMFECDVSESKACVGERKCGREENEETENQRQLEAQEGGLQVQNRGETKIAIDE